MNKILNISSTVKVVRIVDNYLMDTTRLKSINFSTLGEIESITTHKSKVDEENYATYTIAGNSYKSADGWYKLEFFEK